MFGRITRRLNATFRGPTARDALEASRTLSLELDALRAEVMKLRAVAEPFHTRSGTIDPNIYREVVVGNEYRLPEQFHADDVIVDIGAHIGSFSTACLMRGAGHVVAFEPFPANYALLQVNLARFGARAEARQAAVWRSDRTIAGLNYVASTDPTNTGGGTLLHAANGTSKLLPAVALDQVVQQLLAQTGQPTIRLLKLDCEGSEYPILLSATCLDCVTEICGEYHDVGAVHADAQVAGHTHYTHPVLIDYLRSVGFEVTAEVHPHNPALGLFWARRFSA